MSFAVTQLVRRSRLPKAWKHRAQLKAVLLALADRADDDGMNAWPSVDTIAGEAEISRRTADARLLQLRKAGLIDEQEPPRQHRPRVWCLILETIAYLVPDFEQPDTQHVATLPTAEAQHAAPLNGAATQHIAGLGAAQTLLQRVFGSDPQNAVARHAESKPDTQLLNPDTQHVATELSLLNCPFERREQPRSLSKQEKEEAQKEREQVYAVIKAIALQQLEGDASLAEESEFPLFVTTTQHRCEDAMIAPLDQLRQACTWARTQYRLAHQPSPVTDRWRLRRAPKPAEP